MTIVWKGERFDSKAMGKQYLSEEYLTKKLQYKYLERSCYLHTDLLTTAEIDSYEK